MAARRAPLLLLVLGCSSSSEPPALTAHGHFEVVGREVPVAEVVARLDADGDGGLSRSELQEGIWSRLVEEVAAGLASGAAAAEHSLAHLFERFDGDSSSSLDAHELAAAAVAARGGGGGSRADGSAGDGRSNEERQRQMLRARARAPAPPAAARRRLDEVKELVDDPRCHAPKGFPTAPEGWVCINQTSPIFCTNKKRALDVQQCTWRGECQTGQWLQGGCRYRLCERQSGDRCFNASHYLSCYGQQAHGRTEYASHVRQFCGSGTSCRVFEDGLPPTRRRRTTNCHEECHKGDCHQVCHEDPPDPPAPACVREGCRLLAEASFDYVRRCVSVPV